MPKEWQLRVVLLTGRAQAGVGGYYQDRTRQEPSIERHMDVLERVLVVITHPSLPPEHQVAQQRSVPASKCSYHHRKAPWR